jgi:hypothetical protein
MKAHRSQTGRRRAEWRRRVPGSRRHIAACHFDCGSGDGRGGSLCGWRALHSRQSSPRRFPRSCRRRPGADRGFRSGIRSAGNPREEEQASDFPLNTVCYTTPKWDLAPNSGNALMYIGYFRSGWGPVWMPNRIGVFAATSVERVVSRHQAAVLPSLRSRCGLQRTVPGPCPSTARSRGFRQRPARF